jgi:hypothetical protein
MKNGAGGGGERVDLGDLGDGPALVGLLGRRPAVRAPSAIIIIIIIIFIFIVRALSHGLQSLG